ncbi:hypothetical protein HK44_020315 [Pseudomonas fluorescens HK44]|uniref:Uncharacterized protein n=1 Tax=Pseudomonas fluorescens HK44 TaxID=1042209 RepID=A0A010S727_PSEFL|nr:hypothetical protein [Pseudomonas fluorescens]EXF96264.1 hypothetical protein HK44_020315 [Pseudomonas fluorescens HK44]
MSSKIEVSRELAERLAHVLYMHDAEKTGAAKELDALIAAPVVERQPNVIDLDAVDWETIQKAADESNWMPNEYMRNEWVSDVCNFLKYGRAEHPAPPELAELQATIAQLTAENERLHDEVDVMRRGRDAALRQCSTLRAEIERLKGEPVAVLYADGTVLTKDECGKSFDICCKVETPLYTSQPAPVSVVLPFADKVIRKLQRFQECCDDGQGADIGRHWFDLLTQLGLLNRVQRSPALWEITQQGEDSLDKVKELNPSIANS